MPTITRSGAWNIFYRLRDPQTGAEELISDATRIDSLRLLGWQVVETVSEQSLIAAAAPQYAAAMIQNLAAHAPEQLTPATVASISEMYHVQPSEIVRALPANHPAQQIVADVADRTAVPSVPSWAWIVGGWLLTRLFR